MIGRRRIPELLVAGDTEAVERAVAVSTLWSQRIDGRSTRQPRTIDPEALSEATAMKPVEG